MLTLKLLFRSGGPCGALVTVLLAVAAYAAPVPTPSAPSIPAGSYILMDHHSGHLLAGDRTDETMEPASITKMMTAYVVDVAIRDKDVAEDDLVTISENAWRTEGSRMFVEVGTKVSVGDLLKGLIVQSGNDAAVALAEHLAGSEDAFAALMNHHAELLGLTGTRYVNATGLPHADHYTTARDIAKLSRAVIDEFPESYRLYSVREFTYNGIRQYNRNQLLWRDETVDGLKTGHTQSAGYCLAASARRDGQRLISVVLGSPSEKARTSATQALLNYGFRFYTTHKLYDAGESLTETRVWKGAAKQLALGLDDPLYVTVPRGRYDDLQASMIVTPVIEAPVARGTQLGNVNLKLDDEVLAEVPLVALVDVDKGGLMSRMTDHAILLFNSFLD